MATSLNKRRKKMEERSQETGVRIKEEKPLFLSSIIQSSPLNVLSLQPFWFQKK
jgi:hypothetical protein